MRNVFELDDDELEDCVDGSTSVDLIREILRKPVVVDEDGYVDPESFAQWFSYGIEGFIAADPDTDEWEEANENNYEWGYDIACNINNYLDSEESDED